MSARQNTLGSVDYRVAGVTREGVAALKGVRDLLNLTTRAVEGVDCGDAVCIARKGDEGVARANDCGAALDLLVEGRWREIGWSTKWKGSLRVSL